MFNYVVIFLSGVNLHLVLEIIHKDLNRTQVTTKFSADWVRTILLRINKFNWRVHSLVIVLIFGLITMNDAQNGRFKK